MKRLAICCDGTWNTPDQSDGGIPTPTNVVRLYNALADAGEDGVEQRKYYHPGVGTDPGLWSKLAGGGLGAGLDRNIMSSYRYLAGSYQTGDEIYLFGFSRGAYTVRSLAGMVGRCGILDTTDLEEPEVWRRIEAIYKKGYRKRGLCTEDGWRFHAPPKGMEKVPIRFIGVWDTVGALGIPDDMAFLNLLDGFHDYTFHDTELSNGIQTARHAIAMDERRASFQPTLWTDVKDRDVKQVWFPGVHSDVGGGYAETGLSDGALKWMIGESQGNGAANGPCLAFKNSLLNQLKPSHHGVLHDSLKGAFSLLPTMPRSVPCLHGAGAELHGSATGRFEDPPITQAPYRPTRQLAPGDSATIDIFAINPWNDTGLFLEVGAVYELSASGEWLDKNVPCGPDGMDDGNFHLREVIHLVGSALGKAEDLFKQLSGSKDANFLMTKRHEKYPWFCLVGAIANGPGVDPETKVTLHETEKIGTQLTWTPKASGYLYAFANDGWRFYDNNKGSVRLTVRRAK
jgi:hypothetical protein